MILPVEDWLRAKAEEYLQTLPDNISDEVFDSLRGIAETEVMGFIDWLKENNDL